MSASASSFWSRGFPRSPKKRPSSAIHRSATPSPALTWTAKCGNLDCSQCQLQLLKVPTSTAKVWRHKSMAACKSVAHGGRPLAPDRPHWRATTSSNRNAQCSAASCQLRQPRPDEARDAARQAATCARLVRPKLAMQRGELPTATTWANEPRSVAQQAAKPKNDSGPPGRKHPPDHCT